MPCILDFISKKSILPLNSDVIDIIKQFLPQLIYCTECEDYLKCEQLFKNLKSTDHRSIYSYKSLCSRKSYGYYPYIIKGKNIHYSEELLKRCSFCTKAKLCNAHYKRAKFFSNYYNDTDGAICDNCCWLNTV